MNPRRLVIAILCVPALVAAPASAQSAAPLDASGGATPGDGSIVVRPGALLHRTLSIRGTVPALAGRLVRVERLDRDGRWIPVARATADGSGAYRAAWRTDVLGPTTLRLAPDAQTRSSAGPGATARVSVFRPAKATWYGPRFFGRRTACGITLRRSTLGVAHKTLPCGTQISLLHRGRTITVPVIDRGPFANGASWDLTEATAEALDAKATVKLGWLRAG